MRKDKSQNNPTKVLSERKKRAEERADRTMKAMLGNLNKASKAKGPSNEMNKERAVHLKTDSKAKTDQPTVSVDNAALEGSSTRDSTFKISLKVMKAKHLGCLDALAQLKFSFGLVFFLLLFVLFAATTLDRKLADYEVYDRVGGILGAVIAFTVVTIFLTGSAWYQAHKEAKHHRYFLDEFCKEIED